MTPSAWLRHAGDQEDFSWCSVVYGYFFRVTGFTPLFSTLHLVGETVN